MFILKTIYVYTEEDKSLHAFTSQNAGLLRRFGYQFKFDNYDPLSISRIFFLKLKKSGFVVAAEVTADVLADLIAGITTEGQRAVMNGGMAAQLMSKVRHNTVLRINDWSVIPYNVDSNIGLPSL
jgi:hypothetical protein